MMLIKIMMFVMTIESIMKIIINCTNARTDKGINDDKNDKK